LKGDDVVLYSSSGLDITAQQTGNLFPLINSSNVPETRVAPVVVTSAAETLTVSGADAATLSLADPAETQTITVEEISLLSRFEANHALVALDGALDQLSGLRASLGAQQARFNNVMEL
jgi:flagellin-like hook-associated protein FlgL